MRELVLPVRDLLLRGHFRERRVLRYPGHAAAPETRGALLLGIVAAGLVRALFELVGVVALDLLGVG
ncbi:hypothetical protein QJS66_02415 [Kocuria rhizophila]|nr:hypothetical protein QJS66_02415 [Kocuria rhizophila]